MDIDLVRVFVEVVEHGSFTKAARELQMPKSTVSRRLSKLEAQLGVPLVVRTTRSLRLSQEGERFYAGVAPALAQIEEASLRIAEERAEPRGTLRISIPPDYENLPRILSEFREKYPQVHLEVEASSRFVDLVAEGFDCALRAGFLQDSSLIADRLAVLSFALFAGTDYLERHGTPKTLSELRSHQCVLLSRRDGRSVRWTLEGPKGVEHVEPNGVLSANDLMFARNAVAANAGIGLLPFHVLAHHEGLQRILPRYCVRGSALHLVYPSARQIPAVVRAFREHVREYDWLAYEKSA